MRADFDLVIASQPYRGGRRPTRSSMFGADLCGRLSVFGFDHPLQRAYRHERSAVDLKRHHLSTATHEALLTLGKNRDGRTRLVTTNFDRLFEEVIANKSLAVQCFRAPLLRVPKNSWDGLVYLHGLLTTVPTASDLNCLVVSSGDFGLAYLTERWAARFVSELFRNYTVCFVGYSINDPVLRYMMDALAARPYCAEIAPGASNSIKQPRDDRS